MYDRLRLIFLPIDQILINDGYIIIEETDKLCSYNRKYSSLFEVSFSIKKGSFMLKNYFYIEMKVMVENNIKYNSDKQYIDPVNIARFAKLFINKLEYIQSTLRFKYNSIRNFRFRCSLYELTITQGEQRIVNHRNFEMTSGKQYVFRDITSNKGDDIVYDYALSFDSGIFKVKKYNKYGYIDLYGEEVIPVIFNNISDINDGIIVAKDREGFWLYSSVSFKKICNQSFYFCSSFSEGLAFASNSDGGLFGYINRTGNYVVPCKFNKCSPYIDGISVVKEGQNYYYIDKYGRNVYNKEFDYVTIFRGDESKVRVDGKYYLLCKDGRLLLDIERNNLVKEIENVVNESIIKNRYSSIVDNKFPSDIESFDFHNIAQRKMFEAYYFNKHISVAMADKNVKRFIINWQIEFDEDTFYDWDFRIKTFAEVNSEKIRKIAMGSLINWGRTLPDS